MGMGFQELLDLELYFNDDNGHDVTTPKWPLGTLGQGRLGKYVYVKAQEAITQGGVCQVGIDDVDEITADAVASDKHIGHLNKKITTLSGLTPENFKRIPGFVDDGTGQLQWMFAGHATSTEIRFIGPGRYYQNFTALTVAGASDVTFMPMFHVELLSTTGNDSKLVAGVNAFGPIADNSYGWILYEGYALTLLGGAGNPGSLLADDDTLGTIISMPADSDVEDVPGWVLGAQQLMTVTSADDRGPVYFPAKSAVGYWAEIVDGMPDSDEV